MPKPHKGERKVDYISRCMSDPEMISKHSDGQERYAVCRSFFVEYAADKISFDYDGTLSTDKGKELAKHQKGSLYIISARSSKEGMLSVAKELGIDKSKIFATGSNKAKIEKIKELGIKTHYDNNPDVVKELGPIGKLI